LLASKTLVHEEGVQLQQPTHSVWTSTDSSGYYNSYINKHLASSSVYSWTISSSYSYSLRLVHGLLTDSRLTIPFSYRCIWWSSCCFV